MHFSQSVQVSLIVLLWGKSYENVSSIRYVEKIYMRCRKTEQVLCRKPLGKNINLMIWCLCNHQSDLNYDKMVVLLDSIYCIKVVLKLHSSNITPKLLQENSYPAGRRRHLKSRILWPSPKTYFSLICNFAFVNMDCVVVWKIQAFTFFFVGCKTSAVSKLPSRGAHITQLHYPN